MEKKSLSGGIDKGPGIYRIRDGDDLLYIGRTSKCLLKELKGLNKGILKGKVAKSDHPAAQCLWAFYNEGADNQEVSVLHHDGGEDEKTVLECYLVWKYRLAKGESPHCNFKRIHPVYMKAETKDGIGLERMEDSDSLTVNVSQPPLDYGSSFKENDWMGLHWSDWGGFERKALKALPNKQGFYRVADADMTQMLLLRRVDNLKAALKKQGKEKWARHALFSYTLSAEGLEGASMAEVENDLIAGYYEETGLPPTYQFGYRKAEEVVKTVINDTPEPSVPAEEEGAAEEAGQEPPEEEATQFEEDLRTGFPDDEEAGEEEDHSPEDAPEEPELGWGQPNPGPLSMEDVPRTESFLGEEDGEGDKRGKKKKSKKRRK